MNDNRKTLRAAVHNRKLFDRDPRLQDAQRRYRLSAYDVTHDIEDDQSFIKYLLERDIGIDKYFTYLATNTVKGGAELHVESLQEGS